jgi:O-antigen/teichoic acid export membrane protein
MLLPPFLARWLTPEQFGGWALSLQAAGFLNYLNFGLQLVAARFIATADATGDRALRDRVVATSMAALLVLGLIGLFAIFLFCSQLERFVPHATPELREQMRHAMLWLAASYCIQLPLSILLAIFIGLRQNGYYAFATFVGRAGTFVAVLITAFVTRDIVAASQAWFVGTVLGGIFWIVLWRVRSPDPTLKPSMITSGMARTLVKESGPLAVWSLAMLFTAHFQILIVARYDYAAVPAFASAFALSMLGIGLLQAAGGSVVPQIGAAGAGDQRHETRKLLYRATHTLNLVLGLGTAFQMVAGWWIMRFWLGPAYAAQGAVLLTLLALLQCIRGSGGTYSMVAIGVGVQGRMTRNPIIEALVSFGLAWLLAPRFGAVGVGLGMCVAGLVGVALMMRQNPLRDRVHDLDILPYVWRCLLLPLAPVYIAIGAVLVMPVDAGLLAVGGVLLLCGAVGAAVTTREDRAFVMGLLKRRA